MPFKSKQQMKWMFANKPEMAQEWADKTKNTKKLPEKVTKPRAGKKIYPAQKRSPKKVSK